MMAATAPDELFQSATDAADMLSRQEISSRELTEMLLARIDAVNPALNSVFLEPARESLRGGPRALTRFSTGIACLTARLARGGRPDQ